MSTQTPAAANANHGNPPPPPPITNPARNRTEFPFPQFSEITSKICEESDAKCRFPASMYGEYSLRNRADYLALRRRQNIEDMADLHVHPTRNRIMAIVRTAFAIVIIVGGILGTTVMATAGSPLLALTIASVACIAYGVLCYYNVHCIRERHGFTYALVRPYLPLFEHDIIQETFTYLTDEGVALDASEAEVVAYFKDNCERIIQLKDELKARRSREEIEQKHAAEIYSKLDLIQASKQVDYAISFFGLQEQTQPEPIH